MATLTAMGIAAPPQTTERTGDDLLARRSIVFTLAIVATVIFFALLLFTTAVINSIIAVRTNSATTVNALLAGDVQRLDRIVTVIQKIKLERRAESSSLSVDQEAFTRSLHLLQYGGPTKTDTGKTVIIAPDEERSQALAPLAPRWGRIDEPLRSYLDYPSPTALANVYRALDDEAPAIRDGLLALANRVTTDAADDALRLSRGRDVLIAATIFVFVLILAVLLSQVRANQGDLLRTAADLERQNVDLETASRALAESKSESDTIMDTVPLGLFLIDANFSIRGTYSRSLEEIFRQPQLENYNIANVLQRLLPERMFVASRDFLAMLFDKEQRMRTLLKINPMRELEVSFPLREGGFEHRFLSFTFQRVVRNAQIERVFVAVTDVTDAHRLQEELRLSEQRKERQFQFLLGVLHVQPSALDEFIGSAKEHFAEMSAALRSEDFAGKSIDVQRSRLDRVFRAVHSIKGHAAMLKLSYFVSACQDFESKISMLRNRMKLSGDDFLSVVLAQSQIQSDLEELREVRDRFVGVASEVLKTSAPAAKNGATVRPERDSLVDAITDLAETVASSSGKQVRVEFVDFDLQGVEPSRRGPLRDILVQLTRNALVHGIELPQERARSGKDPVGRLLITREAKDDATKFSFTFRDDGRGIDVEAIRRKAVEKGMITPEEAATMSAAQVVGLIFRDGFSTAETVTTDAGRGVGMSVIKTAVTSTLRGQLRLKSEPGRHTEFFVSIPTTQASTLVAAAVKEQS